MPTDWFRPDLAADWGRHALQELADCAPVPQEFAAATGLPDNLAAAVRPRVVAKLDAEPAEDLRLDFEDRYHLAAAVAVGSAPPFTGLRCKNLEPTTRGRAIRTLDVFLAEQLALARCLPGSSWRGRKEPPATRLLALSMRESPC